MIYTEATAEKEFGPIIDGVWADEAKHMVTMDLTPFHLEHWINTATGLPVTHIYMNRELEGPLELALRYLCLQSLTKELMSFDGCFQIRKIRGSQILWSAHSWGLAVDLNASQNPLGSMGSWTPEFIQCFKDAGFVYGGDFSRRDPMHFSLGF